MVALSNENMYSSSVSGTKRGNLHKRYKQLEDYRSSWRSHWMEISDYLFPRRGRFLIDSQNNRGRRRNNKIIDSTGTQALRTLAAGLMSGMTSPARPWFRFALSDPDLHEEAGVKEWLAASEKVCRNILHRSNFYNTIYNVYGELGAFGTAPLYRQRNFDDVVRFRPFTAGEYVIAENAQGKIDTLGREFTMTVAQLIEKFCMDPETGKIDFTGVSSATKRLWNNKNYDSLVTVMHMIQPRMGRDTTKSDAKNKAYMSCYFEKGADNDDVLEEGGYDTFPAYVARWDVLPGDVYGRCPGMDYLGDVKQLQHQQKRKAQAIDKMVNPPMVAPASLRGRPTTVIPGGTTYVDATQGGQGFIPAYQVTPRLQEMMVDIREVQDRIQRGFYADLFAMMIQSDRRQMTATEVVERHEEKLVLLGPVLQRVNVELLDPLMDDVFTFALEAELIPEAPEAIAGQDLRVEYVSLLAQAQQAVAASSMERTLGFAGNLVAVFPEIVDNIDADKAIREYSEILGNAANLLVDKEQVDAMRAQRQADQAQMMQQQQQAAMAQNAKVLSQTDTQRPNALTQLLQGGASRE